MKHYIIYIPGLGDHYDGVRRCGLFFWQFLGVKTKLVPMQWYAGGSYDERCHQVEVAIKRAQDLGYVVSVVGESAGASMAMNVFAANESLHKMISLAGVNSQTTPISSHIFKKSSAFEKSVSLLKSSQRVAVQYRSRQIISVTALSDPTVPVDKNIIPQAKHIRVWSFGHFTTILLCLSFYSFVLVREVKRPV